MIRKKRSFIGGTLFVTGAFFFILFLLYVLLDKASAVSPLSESLIFIGVYGVGLLLFLGTCLYFIINTHIMSTKEGRSVTAKLSAVLGLNILIVVPLTFYLLVMGTPLKWPLVVSILVFTFLLVDLLFTLLFGAYLVYSWFTQKFPIKRKVDYIIVLGSGIRSEEVPPLLKSRLDKGIEYYQKNPEACFIVSGGQGADEPVSEAFAMGNYLLSQNIPKDRIILEDRSRTTLENMQFSKEKILADWQGQQRPSVIFTTNNYHVLRGALYAGKVGLKADGVGAPTALYFLPTALIREFIALLIHYKWFSIGLILLSLLFTTHSFLPF
nr:YdcF family protein [Enterococcus sp. BWR-S5]